MITPSSPSRRAQADAGLSTLQLWLRLCLVPLFASLLALLLHQVFLPPPAGGAPLLLALLFAVLCPPLMWGAVVRPYRHASQSPLPLEPAPEPGAIGQPVPAKDLQRAAGDGEPDSSAADLLNHILTIRRNGEHILAIISDSLDLSKIDPGPLSVELLECSQAQGDLRDAVLESAVVAGPPLYSEYADDTDMTELVEEFVAHLPVSAAALRAAEQRGDFAELRSLSHQLRGAAGGYGFTPITDAAARVEDSLRGAGAPDAAVLHAQLSEVLVLCARARAGSS